VPLPPRPQISLPFPPPTIKVMRIDCAYPLWVVFSESKIREHGSVLKVGPARPWDREEMLHCAFQHRSRLAVDRVATCSLGRLRSPCSLRVTKVLVHEQCLRELRTSTARVLTDLERRRAYGFRDEC